MWVNLDLVIPWQFSNLKTKTIKVNKNFNASICNPIFLFIIFSFVLNTLKYTSFLNVLRKNRRFLLDEMEKGENWENLSKPKRSQHDEKLPENIQRFK